MRQKLNADRRRSGIDRAFLISWKFLEIYDFSVLSSKSIPLSEPCVPSEQTLQLAMDRKDKLEMKACYIVSN